MGIYPEYEISTCSVCGEVTERYLRIPSAGGSCSTKIRVPCMCRCQREKQNFIEQRFAMEENRRQIEKLKSISLLDAKSRNIFFKNCKVTDDNAKAFAIARKYVVNFDEMYKKSQGLLFWGDVGTGKSYAASAIANELLERMQPVVMTSFVKLLNEAMKFDSGNEDITEKFNQAKLLIIDDLGAERGTDFALEKVYDIVDSRYRSGKPVIFTTNLTIKQMKDSADIRYNRIYDRIFEMCYPVKFSGLSWRKKDAAERFADMKKLLED